MTYFAIICSTKRISSKFGGISINTNRGKAKAILHMGQIIAITFKQYFNCSDMTYFTIISSTKKIQANLEVSEVLINYVTNRGKARVMLHIGAGHSNNCQIMLKLLRYDTFCNKLQYKKISSKFGGIRGINHLCYK